MGFFIWVNEKEDAMDELFLPEEIKEPMLPSDEEWTPETAIERITRLSKRVQRLKPAVEDIIMEFWIAHEMIVNKKIQGWTWGRFCEECGYHPRTPYTWFDKYGMSWTRSFGAVGNRDGNKSLKKLSESESATRTTNPEIKEKLNEVNEAIKAGEITNKDLEGTRKALVLREENKERQEDFKSHFPKKSRIRLLNDKMAGIIDELTYLADGNIELEGGDETWIKAIKMKGPGFIWQFHKLGVDLQKVYRTLINPGKELGYESEREKRNEWDQQERIIDVTPRKVS
jgi:hypothetical protein